jgi:hypothetical protein
MQTDFRIWCFLLLICTGLYGIILQTILPLLQLHYIRVSNPDQSGKIYMAKVNSVRDQEIPPSNSPALRGEKAPSPPAGRVGEGSEAHTKPLDFYLRSL